MDSSVDLQTLPQEQSQSVPPPNDLSPATPTEHPESSRASDAHWHDSDARARKRIRNEQLRTLGKTFGSTPGVPIFTRWRSRLECSNAAVHRSVMGGICGNGRDGVYSIALSNAYQDDEDGGDVIIYTGAGGREKWTNTFPPKRLRLGPQTLDQSWDAAQNKALIISFHTGNPIRVIRSWRCGSKYAPLDGYRYDGLYTVAACWTARGHNDRIICRCRLERLPDQPPIPLRPITLCTSRGRCKERLVSRPHDFSDHTNIDVGFGRPGPSSAPSTGSVGGAPVELPNPPQQRALSEASTRIDFNTAEVDRDVKVPESPSPQRQVPSALPRYMWDQTTNTLVRIPASRLVQDVADGEDEEHEEQLIEDDVTVVSSEADPVHWRASE